MSRSPATKKLILIGSPNVGKSMLFNYLTGMYVIVSNYPGTTVEVAWGRGKLRGREYEVIDTPGFYSLWAVSEEECVTRRLLFQNSPDLVLHVANAINLDRMLNITLQLREANLPAVLVVNMIDEAKRVGLSVDRTKLEEMLGIPVVITSLITGQGLNVLKRIIEKYFWGWSRETSSPDTKIIYPAWLEKAVFNTAVSLGGDYLLSKRTTALLLLQDDDDFTRIIKQKERNNFIKIEKVLRETWKKHSFSSIYYTAMLEQQKKAQKIISYSLKYFPSPTQSLTDKLGDLMINPLSGIPILLLVLYFGFYKFVGGFGAGFLVDLLENIYKSQLIPRINNIVTLIIPYPLVRDLLAYEYGILTLSFRYALAIIMPIVVTFFLFFSIIEDSGYLPRLAYLINNLMAKIGLNGRSIIPFALGIGCGTMAILVTRTLETKRERFLVSFLLSLAIPCSAQIGLIMSILSSSPWLLIIWLFIMGSIFITAAILADRVFPGSRSKFYLEIPPLRLPRLDGIWRKTLARLKWYIKEVIPLFMLISVLIWAGSSLTDFFERLNLSLKPLMELLGLPQEITAILILGFLRRDYGAAGLFDLQNKGLLTGNSLLVAAVVLTLFLPCVAQFTMMIKELGIINALLIAVIICVFALGVGMILNFGLQLI